MFYRSETGLTNIHGLYIGRDRKNFEMAVEHSARFGYRPLTEALKQYDPAVLKDGWNMVDGEEIFSISNPALGLWVYEA